ncbi:MAG: carboxymuconolactone decarboxylase family protein [Planctomycetota bacterium]|jgi:4-carboxymuconolactone decarboxylase
MRIRHLVRIAASAALGTRGDLMPRYSAALDDGVSADDLWEATLQVFLFAGYPRTIGALQVLSELVDTPPPLEPQPPDAAHRGLELFERIYADQTETVRRMLDDLHPDFARFTLEHAYGKVLSRPFLPARERELMAVAMLGVMGLKAQLQSHVKGALRCGATPEEVLIAAEEAPDEQRTLVQRTVASFEE